MVGPVARCPDHGIDLELRTVGEAQRPTRGADHARLEADAVATLELTRARSDQRVPISRATPDSRVDRLLEHTQLGQPPEEVAAEDPLRQRSLARADRELHFV